MYSIVLMAAMVTTPATPDWFRGGCCSCYGGGYSYGCGGCYGGCCGGYTYGGYGAAGGCYGYHGGCYGGFGVMSGDPYYVGGCTGCYGCYGGYSCYGVPVPIPTTVTAPTGPRMPPLADPYPPINPKKTDKKPGEEEIAPLPEKVKKLTGNVPTKATVRIVVPAGAKLYVDDRHIDVPSGTRVFQTPALAPGERYFYDVRIEIAGRSEQRRVVLGAGADVAVDFPNLRSMGAVAARR